MRDLIKSLWTELRTLVHEIQDPRARAKKVGGENERQLHTLVWALTVLLSDPPAGDPATADSYLCELLEREEAEIRTEIVARFRRLR